MVETFPPCDPYQLMIDQVSRRIRGDDDAFVVPPAETVRCMRLLNDIGHDTEAAVRPADWPTDPWVAPRSIRVADGTRLAVRVLDGDERPIVLVHGLASNALLWQRVAESLNGRGHPVAAVDLRAHGRSDRPTAGHDTHQAAVDLGDIATALGWSHRRPVLAGQSWGGNVVLRATHDTAFSGGALTVDGGWIHLGRRFTSFDDCWRQLAPPDLTGRDSSEVLGWIQGIVDDWPDNALAAIAGNLERHGEEVRNRLNRDFHRSILHSLWADDPSPLYPGITQPTHLMVAGRSASTEVEAALTALPDATVAGTPTRTMTFTCSTLTSSRPLCTTCSSA